MIRSDGLTGLLNRRFFLDQIRARRDEGYPTEPLTLLTSDTKSPSATSV